MAYSKLRAHCKRIVILSGKTFRGIKYFEETAFDVSDNFADQLVADGVARLHEDTN